MAYTDIDDPSAHFQIALHAGAANATITNDGNSDLKPDLLWSKARGAAHNHGLYDSTRGVTKLIESNTTTAENTASAGYDLISFNTDGFSTGNNQFNTICGGTTYVAWQWKANGGTTTSVSASGTGQASINASTHQVNQDAGFSIITYTGRDDQISNGEETKLTHGLGVAPDFTIMKKRDGTGDWIVMGKNVSVANPYSFNEHLILNTTAALNAVTYTGNIYPDSTYIYLGKALMNDAGDDYVCYAFAEKQGYSKFGKYVGNGNANGPFVYTGFKPAFVMVKRIDTAGYHWRMHDSARDPFNVSDKRLTASSSDAEGSGSSNYYLDMLSNGFKWRTNFQTNVSGGTYIYMAFAENPFVTSTGIPATAR